MSGDASEIITGALVAAVVKHALRYVVEHNDALLREAAEIYHGETIEEEALQMLNYIVRMIAEEI